MVDSSNARSPPTSRWWPSIAAAPAVAILPANDLREARDQERSSPCLFGPRRLMSPARQQLLERGAHSRSRRRWQLQARARSEGVPITQGGGVEPDSRAIRHQEAADVGERDTQHAAGAQHAHTLTKETQALQEGDVFDDVLSHDCLRGAGVELEMLSDIVFGAEVQPRLRQLIQSCSEVQMQVDRSGLSVRAAAHAFQRRVVAKRLLGDELLCLRLAPAKTAESILGPRDGGVQAIHERGAALRCRALARLLPPLTAAAAACRALGRLVSPEPSVVARRLLAEAVRARLELDLDLDLR